MNVYKILEAGVKPVELKTEEIKMIKKRDRYKRLLITYVLGIIAFSIAGISELLRHEFGGIIFLVVASVLVCCLNAHVNTKITHAFYGTVTKKEMRYGIPRGRSAPHIRNYSDTEADKSKKNCIEYYFVSVMINGKEFDGIFCYDSEFKKIEAGSEIIIVFKSDETEGIAYKKEINI